MFSFDATEMCETTVDCAQHINQLPINQLLSNLNRFSSIILIESVSALAC